MATFEPDEWDRVIDAMPVKKASRFESMTDEDLRKIAERQPEEAIGLSPIAEELLKRQDSKAAMEELSHRGLSK